MKFTTIASATALLAVSLLAGAADSPAVETGTAAAERSQPATSAPVEPNCLQSTGSRIKPSTDQPCVAGPGQVITREQLDRTGAATTAEALRKASPAVH